MVRVYRRRGLLVQSPSWPPQVLIVGTSIARNGRKDCEDEYKAYLNYSKTTDNVVRI